MKMMYYSVSDTGILGKRKSVCYPISSRTKGISALPLRYKRLSHESPVAQWQSIRTGDRKVLVRHPDWSMPVSLTEKHVILNIFVNKYVADKSLYTTVFIMDLSN